MKVPGTGLPDLEGGRRGWAAHLLILPNARRNFRKKRALLLGTSARSARMARRRKWRNDETARNRRRDAKNGRSMPLGTLQDTGKALSRPFDHRVTHGGHGKTAKAAEEALRAQNGLSAEAPLRPNPLSLHAPRACPTLRDSLPPHAAIGGNAWGTAPSSKRRPNVGRLQYYEHILNTAKREPTGDTTNNRQHNKQTDDTTAQQYKHHSPHKATQHMTHASHTPNTQPRRPPSTLSLPHTSNSSTASSIAASDITAPKTTHCATCVTRDVAVGE
jgi:hypothetical protein